jgi:hypothetical protein
MPSTSMGYGSGQGPDATRNFAFSRTLLEWRVSLNPN